MAALTIELDDRLVQVLERTAIRRGTTIDALLTKQVEPLLSDEREDAERWETARAELDDLMQTSSGRLEPGYKWDRAELYEHRMRPRHERSDLRGSGPEG